MKIAKRFAQRGELREFDIGGKFETGNVVASIFVEKDVAKDKVRSADGVDPVGKRGPVVFRMSTRLSMIPSWRKVQPRKEVMQRTRGMGGPGARVLKAWAAKLSLNLK